MFVERLAAGLARAGHDPIVQWFPHRCELMPWRLKRVPAPPGVDLVHANSWQGFAFKRPGLPLVVTEHHYILHPLFKSHRGTLQRVYHTLFIAQCIQRSYRCADALVAVSNHTAEAMKARFSKPVSVVHNWIDAERYRAGVPEVLTAPRRDRNFRLLFVGNPSRWKGTDVLPKLAARLGERFEIWCLGGLRKSFGRFKGHANLIPLRRVAPDRMPMLYGQVDAVLITARYEAFGYVALEAMACGKPVIGFGNTGTREVCIHDETALLSPTDDLGALAGSCERVASDGKLAERLGVNGYRRALTVFSQTGAISAYLKTYRDLLEINSASTNCASR